MKAKLITVLIRDWSDEYMLGSEGVYKHWCTSLVRFYDHGYTYKYMYNLLLVSRCYPGALNSSGMIFMFAAQ